MNIILMAMPVKMPISNGNTKQEINAAKPGIKSVSENQNQLLGFSKTDWILKDGRVQFSHLMNELKHSKMLTFASPHWPNNANLHHEHNRRDDNRCQCRFWYVVKERCQIQRSDDNHSSEKAAHWSANTRRIIDSTTRQ